MAGFQFDTDSILLILPMVAILFAAVFRLDELFARPVKMVERGRRFSHQDENGFQVCVEPDGRLYREMGDRRS